MKTQIKAFALAALAAASIGAATTSAQAYSHGRDNQIEFRLNRLDQRIDQGVRTRDLSRNEAGRLREDLRDIERLSYRFERSGRGFDRQELAVLDSRMDRLSQRIAYNRNDRDYRDHRRY